MEAIRIGVVRDRAYGSGDGFQVFVDDGGGVIDWGYPMTPRRISLWPDAVPCPGHMSGGHVESRHLDEVCPDGCHEGTHLLDRHLLPAASVAFVTPAHVFGRFRHVVVIEDAAGNRAIDQASVRETVINAAPPAPADLRPLVFDPAMRRMTFSFTPSEKLIG